MKDALLTLTLVRPVGGNAILARAECGALRKLEGNWKIDSLNIQTQVSEIEGKTHIENEVSETGSCFLSYSIEQPDALLSSFYGPVTAPAMFRQSPHDPSRHNMTDLVQQPIPMAILADPVPASPALAAVCNHPGTCGNYSVQDFIPSEGKINVLSGAPGASDIDQYFHEVTPGEGHIFTFILFEVKNTKAAANHASAP
jgi:hypothetical protein